MSEKKKTVRRPINRTIYGSVDELARELGISRQSAYTALRQGKIPSIRLGKRFIIPRSAIAEWLRKPGEAQA
ncbi:MAG: helix-turn-helix domain-containing protein [Bryobacteraceae bacterium]|jgi:excisionase family DNA binding protein